MLQRSIYLTSISPVQTSRYGSCASEICNEILQTTMKQHSEKQQPKMPPLWCERLIKSYRKQLIQVIVAKGCSKTLNNGVYLVFLLFDIVFVK